MKKGRMDEIAVADHSGKSSEIVDNGALPRILVVEDNEELRHFMVNILRKDYHVIEAENGKTGLEKIKLKIPDLIV
jgi:response regulator RpfG family c-di-GMP phosphodiesterase